MALYVRIYSLCPESFFYATANFSNILLDGNRVKKTLSERLHHDATGIKMHRDLFSAYLSRHVNQDDTLLWQDAASQYPGSESILSDAWQQSKNREQVGDAERGLIAPEA